MNKEQKPEAIKLAEKLRDAISLIECDFSDAIATNDLSLAAMELESLHTRVQELEAKEAKPAAPVVCPEPEMAMRSYIKEDGSLSGNVACSVACALALSGGVYAVTYLYTRAQVEAMLEAQGVKL